MTTNVSSENEEFIRQAIAEGRFANWDDAINQAVRLLRDDSDTSAQRGKAFDNPDQWVTQLRDWAAKHRGVESPVDYDRESIYANCDQ